MKWNLDSQGHCGLSIVFTLTVIANFAARASEIRWPAREGMVGFFMRS